MLLSDTQLLVETRVGNYIDRTVGSDKENYESLSDSE